MSDKNMNAQSAELFRFIDRDEISSEKITAPRYSYPSRPSSITRAAAIP